MQNLNSADADFEARFDALIAHRGEALDAAEAIAREVLADVKKNGLDAVLRYSAKYDGLALSKDDLRVSSAQIDQSYRACAPDLIDALNAAANRIRAFHDAHKPQDARYVDTEGVTLGWRWTPVDAAGLYAPGGLAAYPSAVLMNAVAAKAAGVERLVMVTPPARVNENPAILAAARIAGVDEVWKIGGAQAIGALAYGAGELTPVDVVVGPGNAFVAAAKKLVFGDVGVDSIAGPSEVFIIADDSANPDWIAVDLLAQAEHDPDAQSVMMSDSEALCAAVARAVEAHLPKAGPSAVESWRRYGAIIRLRSLEEAPELINRAAPEHVEIVTRDPESLATRIRHAGAIFLGAYAPEALGDYVAGPNHVLPTGRRARFASGLSTLAFMKRTTIVGADRAAIGRIGPAAARIADSEGLPAHALSVRIRLSS